jgi:hypothetical protein
LAAIDELRQALGVALEANERGPGRSGASSGSPGRDRLARSRGLGERAIGDDDVGIVGSPIPERSALTMKLADP